MNDYGMRVLLGIALIGVILVGAIILIDSRAHSPATTAEERVAILAAKHPDWDTEMLHLVASAQIRIGMTQQMIIESWGKPDEMSGHIYQGVLYEEWHYLRMQEEGVPDIDFLDFEDGILVGSGTL